MGKKVNYIAQIQKAFELISNGVTDLQELAYACEDEKLRNGLIDYVVQYAHLNYDMSCYLIEELIRAVQDDRDEDDFKNLMKDFDL